MKKIYKNYYTNNGATYDVIQLASFIKMKNSKSQKAINMETSFAIVNILKYYVRLGKKSNDIKSDLEKIFSYFKVAERQKLKDGRLYLDEAFYHIHDNERKIKDLLGAIRELAPLDRFDELFMEGVDESIEALVNGEYFKGAQLIENILKNYSASLSRVSLASDK